MNIVSSVIIIEVLNSLKIHEFALLVEIILLFTLWIVEIFLFLFHQTAVTNEV